MKKIKLFINWLKYYLYDILLFSIIGIFIILWLFFIYLFIKACL